MREREGVTKRCKKLVSGYIEKKRENDQERERVRVRERERKRV